MTTLPNSAQTTISLSALVAGATGSVGRHCVYLLVRDPRISQVTALYRSEEKPFEFYGLNEEEDPVSKLLQMQMDFDEKNNTLDEQLGTNQYAIGLSCIGLYTSDVDNEADFMAKEYVPNMKIAEAAAIHGVKRWSYLSGQGVYITEAKKMTQFLFSWVKGSVERDLQKINGFEMVSSARPGFILGRPPSKYYGGFSGWLEKKANSWNWMKTSSISVHRNAIAKAMVHSLLLDISNTPSDDNSNNNAVDDSKSDSERKTQFIVYENEEIKRVAAEYDNQLSK